MSHHASIVPSGESFQIDAGESVLDAALRQGCALNYGCRHGNCSSCKYFLEAGDVDHGAASIYSLTEAEREAGFALLCCARPLTDLVIAAREGDDPRAAPLLAPTARAATIDVVEPVTARLWRIMLALDAPLAFYPGQFIEIQIPGTALWRSYSIASAPARSTQLELVIKHLPGGAFSGHLPTLARGLQISMRGPFGTSYLRAGTAPVLLVATGSGIAPLMSILDDARARADPRRFDLFFGARSVADLPFAARLQGYADHFGERFSYCPTLTQGAADWRGRRGRVTQALQREIDDASRYDAYLCGAPAMCDASGALLEAKGIRTHQLFYDRFHAAS